MRHMLIAEEVVESILDRIKQRKRDLFSKLKGDSDLKSPNGIEDTDDEETSEILKMLKFHMNSDKLTSVQIEKSIEIGTKRMVDGFFRKLGLDQADSDTREAKEYLSDKFKEMMVSTISEELQKEGCGFDSPKLTITIKR